MPSATLARFAQVNDAAAATPSKLAKQRILAGYFAELDLSDLRLAVRFAAGRPFPATDPRALNVGGALVADAILDLLALDPSALHALAVQQGELGEALARVWPDGGPASAAAGARSSGDGLLISAEPPAGEIESPATGPLTLDEASAEFGRLAETGPRQSRTAIVRRLFARCRSGREAAYLAKIIFGDLRTGVQEGVLQSAIAAATGASLADVLRCQLLVGDLDEVAELARRNELGSAKFRLFHPILPMLAIARETPEACAQAMAGADYFVEDKLDGIRAQAHKAGRRVALYTRDLARADGAFPDVSAALAALPGDFLLDGEIVAWAGGQVLPFAAIQKRLGRKAPSARVIAESPCRFIAFDLLYRDGRPLLDLPLVDRRRELDQLAGADLHRTAPRLVSSAEEIASAFESARGRRNEGIVLKDPASAYSPGRRGQFWIKLKTHLPTLDCVVTAAETGHGKRRNWLSDYTFAVWDRDPAEVGAALLNVGKAYSGLTEAEIIDLTERFTRLTISQAGRTRLVTPSIVLEIACDQIQISARHGSGYALRFPRIKRIRWDKRPEDADRIERVAEIYAAAANFGRQPPPPAPPPSLFD